MEEKKRGAQIWETVLWDGRERYQDKFTNTVEDGRNLDDRDYDISARSFNKKSFVRAGASVSRMQATL